MTSEPRGLWLMRADQLERRLQRDLDALPKAARAELHVLMLLDLDRAERIGEFWSYPQTAPSPSC